MNNLISRVSLATWLFWGLFFGSAVVGLISSSRTALALSANQQAVCEAIGSGTDCDKDAGGGTKIDSVVSTVITILTAVVGVAAVIMIIVAGFKYITSAGDTAKLTSAKNTLVYAITGLVIVALAQTIAKFVLSTATGNNKPAVTCKAPKVRDPKTNTCINP